MGLMKKLTSAVVASSLVLGLVGTAFAAPSAEQNQKAFDVLSTYEIVKGNLMSDGTVSPDLNGAITRAQLVTIIVRAFGQDDTAKLLNGAASFSDVPVNEWYSGYAALAKNIAAQKGIVIGYEDGSFRPNQNVSMVEALAFIMKFLGVAPGTGANWAADTISAAKDAGIITVADADAYLADPSAAATRGNAFGLAYSIFSTAEVTPGKTVLTSYVDTEGPVLTINKPAEPTTTSAAITVTGKVEGAVALYFGTEQITANADGTFTQEVALNVGANTVSFSAVDLAGNVTPASFDITRNAGVAAKVVAQLSSNSIAAGGTADVTVKVLDENDVELQYSATDVSATYGGEIGTYDAATGKFTASTKAGTGTLTVKVGELVSEAVTINVVAGDLAGVTADNYSVAKGDKITLTAVDAYGNAISGASFTVDSTDALLVGNVLVGSEVGTYTVTASAGDKTASTKVGVYGGIDDIAITGVETAIANDQTLYTFTVKAVDENGNVVGDFDGSFDLTGNDVSPVDEDGDAITSVEAENGVATFTAKVPYALAGAEVTVVAAYTDADANEFSGSTTFEAIEQVPTAIKVTAPTYLDAGVDTSEKITIKVLDQVGKTMESGTWAMSLSINGPALFDENGKKTLTDAISATGTDVYFSREDTGETGTITFTAEFTGLTTATATTKAVIAQSPAKVTIKAVTEETVKAANLGYAVYEVSVTDKNGVPVAYDSDVEVALDVTTTQAGQILYAVNADDEAFTLAGITSSLVSKKATVAFDGEKVLYLAVKAGKFTGNLVATTASTDLTNVGSATVSFKAGDVADIAVSREAIDLAVSAASTTVSAYLVDASGNKIMTAGNTIEFAATDSKVTIETKKAKTDANGVATTNVSVLPYTNSYEVTATYTYEDETTSEATATINVKPAVATALTVGLYNAAADGSRVSQVTAGESVYVRVAIKDSFGSFMSGTDHGDGDYTGLVLETVNGEVAEQDTLDELTWTEELDANDNPYAVAVVTAKTSGTLTLKVTDSSTAADIAAQKSVNVKAGPVAAVAIAEATDDGITLTQDEAKKFTLQIVDDYGNLVNPIDVDEDVVFTFTFADGQIRLTESGSPVETVTITAGSNTKTVWIISDAAADTYEISGSADFGAGTIELPATDVVVEE